MPEPKKYRSKAPPADSASPPQSRVRIKPQGGGAADGSVRRGPVGEALEAATSEAMEQLIAQADAEQWPVERFVECFLALHHNEAAKYVTPEDLEEIERQARAIFLDPKFR